MRTSLALLCVSVSGLLLACSSDDVSSGETGAGNASVHAGSGAKHYTLFEAGPVRPVAVMPSGIVAVTNVPDDRVELFKGTARGLKQCGSVKVGMRPVAVSAVGDKLWVVNHLSDSVSVVKLDGCSGYVERTLLVGDEPRDVVSAKGAAGNVTRSSPPRIAARTSPTRTAAFAIPS